MRPRIPLLALASCAAVALSACGSEERDLVDRAIKAPVRDADTAFVVRLADHGTDVMRFTLRGPYHSNGDTKIPSFDLRMALGIQIAGRQGRIPVRAVGTGEDVFVVLGGQTYQLGAERYRRIEQRGAQGGDAGDLGDLERAGIDLESWFPEADVVGDERLFGEQVTHLEGRLDVSAMLQNIARLARSPRTAKALGLPAGALDGATIEEIDKTVTDPRLDVFVGKADGAFRRIAATMGITIPGLSEPHLDLRLDLRNVGEVNTIDEAPAGPYQSFDALEAGLQRELQQAFGQNATV